MATIHLKLRGCAIHDTTLDTSTARPEHAAPQAAAAPPLDGAPLQAAAPHADALPTATEPDPAAPSAAPEPDALTIPVPLSIITVAPGQGRATKRIIHNAQKLPIKDPHSQPSIAAGTLELVTVNGLEGLAALLAGVDQRQAIVHGVPIDQTHGPLWKLITEKNDHGLPGTITRTKKTLHFPPGYFTLMTDYDDDQESPPAPLDSAQALVARLAAIWPAFATAGYLTTFSTSSCIRSKATGAWLNDPAGMHLTHIARGDVERFRTIVQARLLLSGEFFTKLASPNSQTGRASILTRHLIDMAVYSPERLDFVAGAEIAKSAPFYQDMPPPQLVPGHVLDLDALPDLSPEEAAESQRLLAAAKEALKPRQREGVRDKVRAQHPEMDDEAVARETTARLERAERGELTPDHLLSLDTGKTVRAGDIRRAHDRLTLADPEEPGYGLSKAIIYWNSGGHTIRIHSLAHGLSRTYCILPRPGTPDDDTAASSMDEGDPAADQDGEVDEDLSLSPRAHQIWHAIVACDAKRRKALLFSNAIRPQLGALPVYEYSPLAECLKDRVPRLNLNHLERTYHTAVRQARRERQQGGTPEHGAPSCEEDDRDPVRAERGQYQARRSGLRWMKETLDGRVPTQLTNFDCRIVTDLALDDGAEVRRMWELEATHDSTTRRFTISADQYPGMSWVPTHLGAQALLIPGFTLKDHARAAIQMLSPQVQQHTIYSHIGWREVAGQWVYLHAGGAIGAAGIVADVDVHVDEGLTRYTLTMPPHRAALQEAIRHSMGLLTCAPDQLMVPLYGAIWRPPLGETDFAVHTNGTTGLGKTVLATLCQQHYGATMEERHLPGSWSSTGNALETLAFLAKDALLVIDDFAPTGAQADIARAHQAADRVLRAQGNRSGRGRLRPDGTLRPVKPPRGLILSTGEDTPLGHSLRARILVLDLETAMVQWDQVTAC